MTTMTTQDCGARSVASVKMGNPSLVFGRCFLSEPPSLLLYVRPAALVGVQGLLLVGQSEATQGAPDGRQCAAEAALLLQLFQLGVVLVPDQSSKSLLVATTQGGSRSTAVRLGSQGASLAPPLQQPDDERQADAEPSSDHPLGSFPVIDRRRDSLTEIYRVGCHGSILLVHCHSISSRVRLSLFSQSAIRQ